MRLRYLLCLPVLLFTCGPAPSPSDEHALPWAEASFLTPIPTPIILVNASDTTWQLAADLRDYTPAVGDVLPDSLHSGETVTVTPVIARPHQMFVGLGHHRSLRVLLPGYSRTLRYDDSRKMPETGPNTELYSHLDGAFAPLHPMPFYPPEITDITAYFDSVSREFTAHLDTLPARPDLPEWVRPLIEREAWLLALQRPLHTRAYRAFFYKDTLAVAEAYLDTVRRALESPLAYHTPSFNDLLGAYSRYLGETGPHQTAGASTRNNWALATTLLSNYPAPAYRHDAIANMATGETGDLRLYDGKAQIIDTLTASLPADYQERIRIFTDSIAASRRDDGALRAFLTTPFENEAGELVTPLAVRGRSKTLYKFWFAGCYPCIVQQPHERELMAEHPDLEVVYVAFSTDRERWLPYLKEHDAPASANLYVPEEQTEVVRDALGRLGAPIYLLLDADDEVRCVNCPKPDDPLLEGLLRG